MLRAGYRIFKRGVRRFRQMLSQPRAEVLYFLHIPKSAGTAFTQQLQKQFRPCRSLTVANGSVDPLLYQMIREFPQLDLITGHVFCGYFLAELVLRPVRTVVVLRDPRAMILSRYKHCRDQVDDHIAQYVAAHCPSLEAFLENSVMRRYVADGQTRYLGHTERTYTPPLIARLKAARTSTAISQVLQEASSQPPPGPNQLLKQALERLEQCDVIGLAEHLDESLDMVARLQKWRPFPTAARVNVSTDKRRPSDLAPDLIRKIDALNELDRIVYAEAQKIFAKQRHAATRVAA